VIWAPPLYRAAATTLTDLRKFVITDVLGSLGVVRKTGTTTVNGVKAVRVCEAGDGA
jgi:hypothetical protein